MIGVASGQVYAVKGSMPDAGTACSSSRGKAADTLDKKRKFTDQQVCRRLGVSAILLHLRGEHAFSLCL